MTTNKAITGAIVAVLAMVLGYLGYELGPEDRELLTGALGGLGVIVVSLIGIYRRVKASKGKAGAKQGGSVDLMFLMAVVIFGGAVTLIATLVPNMAYSTHDAEAGVGYFEVSNNSTQ